MHHPAVAGAHLDVDVGEDSCFVHVYRGVTQRHDDAALSRPATLARLPGMKCTRVLLQQLARLFRSHPAALLHDALLELQQMSHRSRHIFLPMRGEHPRHRRARGAVEPCQEACVVACIEPVGHFVEEQ